MKLSNQPDKIDGELAASQPQTHLLLTLFAFIGIAIGFIDLKYNQPSEANTPYAVAFVNGTPILQSSVDALMSKQVEPVDNALRMTIINTLIDEELAIQDVKKVQLMDSSAELRTEALRALSKQKAFKEGFLPIQDRDLEQFYQQNKARMTPAQALQIDLIFIQNDVRAGERLRDIREKLVAGNAFIDVAQQNGDMAPFLLPRSLAPLPQLRAIMPQPLFELSKKLSEGAISDAVLVDDGWYFLHVIRRQDGRALEYETVKSSITKLLEERALQRAFNMRIEALRNLATIRIVNPPQPIISDSNMPKPLEASIADPEMPVTAESSTAFDPSNESPDIPADDDQ